MSKRLCRKCGVTIPHRVVIDGKQKLLQNRKFCLECSPYKQRFNTKGEAVDKNKCSAWYKEIVTLSLYKRGLSRKAILVESKGGCCQKCGYNKFLRALTFHHRDPKLKSFGLSINNLWSKPWDKIREEVDKCDLLCSNCHIELEAGNYDIVKRVNEKYGTTFRQ